MRRVRGRRPDPDVPKWAAELLKGRAPKRDTPEWDDLLSWAYFADPVEGLPDPRSHSAYVLLRDAGIW